MNNTRTMSSESSEQLQQIQTRFMDYLLHQQHDIASHIQSTRELSSEVRLAIYGNAYYARLTESLEKDYTALLAVLGKDEFTRLAEEYTKVHPSTNPSLREFGQTMPEFLQQKDDIDNREYLTELAMLEFSFANAFDADDVSVATETDAAQVPPEKWPELVMKFHPSIQLFQYQWNILPTWQAVKDEKPLPAAEILPERQTCMVWREELMTRYRTLEPDEASVLSDMIAGENFSGLCEALAPWNEVAESIPMHAATLLKSWLHSGMISELKY